MWWHALNYRAGRARHKRRPAAGQVAYQGGWGGAGPARPLRNLEEHPTLARRDQVGQFDPQRPRQHKEFLVSHAAHARLDLSDAVFADHPPQTGATRGQRVLAQAQRLAYRRHLGADRVLLWRPGFAERLGTGRRIVHKAGRAAGEPPEPEDKACRFFLPSIFRNRKIYEEPHVKCEPYPGQPTLLRKDHAVYISYCFSTTDHEPLPLSGDRCTATCRRQFRMLAHCPTRQKT